MSESEQEQNVVEDLLQFSIVQASIPSSEFLIQEFRCHYQRIESVRGHANDEPRIQYTHHLSWFVLPLVNEEFKRLCDRMIEDWIHPKALSHDRDQLGSVRNEICDHLVVRIFVHHHR